MGARAYDYTAGRFISPDPVFEQNSPDQMGGYTYAANDPVNGADPTGLMLPTDDGSFGSINSYEASTSGPSNPCTTLGENGCDGPVVPGNTDGSSSGSHSTSSTSNVTFPLKLCTAAPPKKHSGFWSWDTFEKVGDGVMLGVGAVGVGLGFVGCEFGSDGIATPACVEGALGAGQALGCVTGTICAYGGETASPASGGSCSFAPDTPVLLADGSTKPIGKIAVGDKVQAADPSTGDDEGGRSVEHTWLNHDSDLVDVTITTKDGSSSTLHTTANHPFWDATTKSWTPAGELKTGDHLASTSDDESVVTAVARVHGESDRYNLTVEQLHTYYVVAGGVPVLVHNECGPSEADAIGARGRAEELQGQRNDYPYADQNGTTAVIGVYNTKTQKWVNRIAINGDGEQPSDWQLRTGEEFVQGPGHAEYTIVRNLGPHEVIGFGGTSRNICWDICYSSLDSDSLLFGGVGYRGGNSDKSPYSLFWSRGW